MADTYNNRIQHFAFNQSNGNTVAGFGSPAQFILNKPTSIILDADKYLFIVDSHNHRIIRSTRDEFRCIAGCSGAAGDEPNQLNYPHSLAFDTKGNLFVTDQDNHRIQKFRITTNPRSKFICWMR